MTEFTLPVMVSVDERERYEVLIPGVKTPRFFGTSLATLLDDLTLHLMETIPKAQAKTIPRFEFNPYVELRKVRLRVERGDKRDRRVWKGRIPVVVTRWKEDDFYVACAPRLGIESFALKHLVSLEQALFAFVESKSKEYSEADLDRYACRYDDFLHILSFEAELPTILPSQPKIRGRKKKSKGKQETERKKKKRELVHPRELKTVGLNLTHRVLDGRLPRAFLRDEIVEAVHEQVCREGAAVLLVGPSGVGKTTIFYEVVRRLNRDALSMQERRDVWQVDGNRIISGMSVVGQWERRVQQMVFELSARQDVLFVEDLPGLVFAGRSAHGDTNVAGYLEPHVTRRELRIVGECTPERLIVLREEAPAFLARFSIMNVLPMDERQTLLCLTHALRARAKEEEVTMTPDALESILGLTRRFEGSAVNPGKSVDLANRVLSNHEEGERDELGRRKIDRKRVTMCFGRQTGLPGFVLWQEEARPHREVQSFFERRIIQQPEAVEAAADVVNLMEQGLNDPSRPLSTFLFVGPTGVGKTETAKAIAEFLFGSAERMLRFDMSEFMAPYTVARLFGDRVQPDGELTRRVHQQPFSVVLLDEIEKAHPAVFDALLQVLGEGRLTNAAGQTVSFTNTIIIMTSNLGVRDAQKRLGFETKSSESLKLHYQRAAEQYFRPEFFNRIDRVVPFESLGRSAIVPLVKQLLEKMLGRRGLKRSAIVVDIDPELVEVLVDEGFDPKYGARSVKRVLEQRLAVPLAGHLVRHHTHELTLAELFPRGGTIEMALTSPRPKKVAPGEGLEPLLGWKHMERRHRRLVDALNAMEEGDDAVALRLEQSRLLQAVDAYSHDPRTDRLTSLADWFAQVEWLRKCLVDLEDEYLTVPQFEEGYRTEDRQPKWLRNYEPQHTRPFATVVARPIRGVRTPFSEGVRARMEMLELDLATLAFLAAHLSSGDTQRVLLSFEAAGSDTESRAFAAALGLCMARAFEHSDRETVQRLATATLFIKRNERIEVDNHWGAQEHDSVRRGIDEGILCAVLLEGPGIRELVAPELGYHVNTRENGPDRVTELIRVRDVYDGSDPMERLRAVERALLSYRKARRMGDARPPHGAMDLVRAYDNGRARDPGTAVEVDILAPKTFHRASTRRIFNDTMRRLS